MKNAAPQPDIAALHAELLNVAASLASLAKLASAGERGSYSRKEFCDRHDLSESQFHKLCRLGKGPRLMKTGSAGVRISVQADLDWVAEREREAARERAAAREPEAVQ
jgi:hypothetical protein